jgi:hypothetical protein
MDRFLCEHLMKHAPARLWLLCVLFLLGIECRWGVRAGRACRGGWTLHPSSRHTMRTSRSVVVRRGARGGGALSFSATCWFVSSFCLQIPCRGFKTPPPPLLGVSVAQCTALLSTQIAEVWAEFTHRFAHVCIRACFKPEHCTRFAVRGNANRNGCCWRWCRGWR